MAYVVSNDGAEEKIRKELPFRNQKGTFYGVKSLAVESDGVDVLPVEYQTISDAVGELPVKYHDSVRAARYIVFSYETPIGWTGADGTRTVPDVGYSPTTGQHQYTVKHAWGLTVHPKRGRELRPAGGGSRSGGIDG